jgi:hypothetical protein
MITEINGFLIISTYCLQNALIQMFRVLLEAQGLTRIPLPRSLICATAAHTSALEASGEAEREGFAAPIRLLRFSSSLSAAQHAEVSGARPDDGMEITLSVRPSKPRWSLKPCVDRYSSTQFKNVKAISAE